MSNCCGGASHSHKKKNFDFILWGSVSTVIVFYLIHLIVSILGVSVPYVGGFAHDVFMMMNSMWWGLLLGIFFVGVVGRIPRELVVAALGKGGTVSGILRATCAGVMLDLCSHGILMVGAKLYERGASVGQVMAFLIASPWNSMSLMFILWALIGGWWMLTFLVLSMVIAFISGFIFDRLVKKGVLNENKHKVDLPENFHFKAEFIKAFKGRDRSFSAFFSMVFEGLKGSKVVMKWLFFGVVLAALVRTFVEPETFAAYFGASLMGLAVTTLAATVIEVCSEGSVPFAADIFNKAGAAGNSFAFMMAGVSTDYTEIMVLKETISWKHSLFLPLITLPQILLWAFVLNNL